MSKSESTRVTVLDLKTKKESVVSQNAWEGLKNILMQDGKKKVNRYKLVVKVENKKSSKKLPELNNGNENQNGSDKGGDPNGGE